MSFHIQKFVHQSEQTGLCNCGVYLRVDNPRILPMVCWQLIICQ